MIEAMATWKCGPKTSTSQPSAKRQAGYGVCAEAGRGLHLRGPPTSTTILDWASFPSIPHSPGTQGELFGRSCPSRQITDYDKLTLEVWTNRLGHTGHAIGLSAKLLKDHMNIFINFEEEMESASQSERPQAGNPQRVSDRSVEELELSVRSYNCLRTPTFNPLASWCKDRTKC